MRLKGHWLAVRWSGEYGVESSSTGTCGCGHWEESCSSQREVRREYQFHLEREAKKLEKKPVVEHDTDCHGPVVGLSMSAAAAYASVGQANAEFARLADYLAQGKIVLTDYQRGLITRAVKDLKEASEQAEGLLGRIVRGVQ